MVTKMLPLTFWCPSNFKELCIIVLLLEGMHPEADVSGGMELAG